MRQIAQPRGAIDGRPDVVGFVAQLHFAGVHADPQFDRRKRRELQLQRERDGVAGTSEGDNEAVALALLDRADPAVRGQ